MQLVWFKRDLRINDHAPLTLAAQQGHCLCLYVYEPEIIQSDEFDPSHLQFINESLEELDQRLRELGGRLTIRVGTVPDVLDELHSQHGIDTLWSHEESGNKITYDRDLRVAAWSDRNEVPWKEIPQNGVVRRLTSRDGWSKQRDLFMRKPLTECPTAIVQPSGVDSGTRQTAEQLGLSNTNKTGLQIGGAKAAEETLHSFLMHRGQEYSSEMSSPVTAIDSCSRLSTYLAWGCISMKHVVHELRERQTHLRELQKIDEPIGNWLKSLRSFESRLSWHCHFMQKLEDEPSIEFENMSRVYDGMREDEFSQSRFDAWCEGQTGYPMVDACMRALHQYSWINFRMRAMLVSFASYHLWLHWRPTAVYLSRHFLDFEPGIHFSQFQMQSGTTGINNVRIYSPIKQVKDQDPDGTFIKEFVPELAGVPSKHIAEPHKMSLDEQSKSGCVIGKDYPEPIVEHSVAYKAARDRIYAVRRRDDAKSEAQRVVKKHGSRKRTVRRKTGRK
ncbi:MAG: FAD-binding domain-containing protein [Planctomycetota bacterium]